MTSRQVAERALGIVERLEKADLTPVEMVDVLHVAGSIVATQVAAQTRQAAIQREIKDE